jgi:hypothetical protein
MLSGIGQHGGTWQTEESSGDAGKYCDALCGTSAAKTSVELKGADFRRRSGHRVDASGNKGIITHTKLNQDMDFLPAVIEMTCTTKTLIRARHQNSAVFIRSGKRYCHIDTSLLRVFLHLQQLRTMRPIHTSTNIA